MIRDSFEGVTTMVIAHRLNTIMDFDRILVFDEGRVVEFDTVSENIFATLY
jgi:ATP-binding cassette subfamily C (CFTR/MRP) protein 1